MYDGRAAVTVRELPPLDPPAVITASEPHAPYPHKTTERDRFADAAREAVVAEADDALLLTHEGWVAEGTVWSVFWWDGAGLHTPEVSLEILPGIGRARVLDLVRGEGDPPRSRGARGEEFVSRECGTGRAGDRIARRSPGPGGCPHDGVSEQVLAGVMSGWGDGDCLQGAVVPPGTFHG